MLVGLQLHGNLESSAHARVGLKLHRDCTRGTSCTAINWAKGSKRVLAGLQTASIKRFGSAVRCSQPYSAASPAFVCAVWSGSCCCSYHGVGVCHIVGLAFAAVSTYLVLTCGVVGFGVLGGGVGANNRVFQVLATARAGIRSSSNQLARLLHTINTLYKHTGSLPVGLVYLHNALQRGNRQCVHAL
jgi:hypothetical protein